MADDQNDKGELDLTDDEAKQLLADADGDDKQPDDKPGTPATDVTDWKAEAEKWRSLSRKNEKSYKDAAGKLQKFEDANKTEAERLQESLAQHQTRAEKAEAALRRREIAEDRAPEHATQAQIRAVAKRLHGESDDDLEKDADELFALLAPAPTAAKTASRPKERLRGGSEPDDDVEETDPRKLAALLPRRK